MGWVFGEHHTSTARVLQKYFTAEVPNIMGHSDRYPCYFYSAAKKYHIFPRFGFLNCPPQIKAAVQTTRSTSGSVSRPGDGNPNPQVELQFKPGVELQFKPGVELQFKPEVELQFKPEFELRFKPDQSIELNDGQEIVADAILERFQDPDFLGGTTLKLEAGQGKTFIALYLLKTLSVRTLIVVHNTNLLFQWKELFDRYFDYEVGILYGKEKNPRDITIAVINTAVKFISSLQFDFIILDECHDLITPERVKLFWHLRPARYILGLSATPTARQNERDQFVPWLVGPILDASKLTEQFAPTNAPYEGHIHKICYYGSPQHTLGIKNRATQKTDVTRTLSMITEDPARLSMIAAIAHECFQNGKNLFIFADRKDYLCEIKAKLDALIPASVSVVQLVGGATSEEIKEAECSKSVILTTYQFMGTGVSIKKMNAIIFATPRRKKVQQFVNRIFRLGSEDTSVRSVYDIVDMRIPCFQSQWNERKKYYDAKGFQIQTEKKHYTDIPIIL